MTDRTEFELAAEQVFAEQPQEPERLEAIGVTLLNEFSRAETDRLLTEQRWLRDLRQYKGQYDPEVEAAIGPNRSKAFVRKTRVKVKTADSRVMDLLFPAGSEKNWDIDSTPVPSLPKEIERDIVSKLARANGGQTPAKEVQEKAFLDVAKQRAKKMAKVIEDQLTDIRYKAICKQVVHSGHLYGTGILKGPLIEKKVRVKFVKEGRKWESRSEEYIVPFVDFVPLWRFYPDMNAARLDQCRYVYERHAMTRAEMIALAQRKTFKREAILDYVRDNPSGFTKKRYFDNELKVMGDRHANQGSAFGQYEVLERWGWLTGKELQQAGVSIPEDRVDEDYFSNVWLLPDGNVIKAVLQPINGVTWPYHLYYCDQDETSIFAEGFSAILRDDQAMINAATRMTLDNAAITAGAMYEVDPNLLHPLTKIDEVFPHKIWLRNANQPGAQAVRPIQVPNGQNTTLPLVQLFENNADEVSAIPRYMTGENVSNGAAGTSSGLSMLMGAVNIVIKDLIANWDEGITSPFVTGLYRWNMQFNNDDQIKGDFDVKARGTASLIAKEVRARQLNEFAAMTANPIDEPYIKRHRLNLLRAEANEMADIVKTEEEVQADQASPQMQMQNELMMRTQMATLAELEGKAKSAAADAKLREVKAAETLANIDKIVARAMAEKMSAIYAALQAAGVAVTNTAIAPAGDELLRSVGFKDAMPDPAIAQILGQGVQAMAGEAMPAGQPNPQQPDVAQPQGPQQGLQPQTGMVGMHQGIETQRID